MAEAERARGVVGPGTVTTPSSTAIESDGDDEDLYGYENDDEFDALCIQAVDKASASNFASGSH